MALLFESYALDVLLTLVTLAYVVYAYFTSTHSYWKDRGIPYFKPSLFFGSMKDLLFNRKGFSDIQLDIYNEAPDAKVVGYFEFRQPKLMIRDPDLVEKVLIKDFPKFHDRGFPSDFVNDPLSGTMFNADGSYWRNLRLKLTPVFTSGKLKCMFDQMYNCADVLVAYVAKQSKINKDKSFECKELMNLFTGDAVASCAFGLQFSHDSEQGKVYRKMIHAAFDPSIANILRFYFRSNYPKLTKLLKLKILPTQPNDYFLRLSKETIRHRRENNINRSDFLQLMLTLQKQEQSNKLTVEKTQEDDNMLNQPLNGDKETSANKFFTDECLAAQSFTFLAAGAEPLANVCSWCLYALANNNSIQEKVQNEIDSVLKKFNGKWSYETVKEMTYLDQVISEAHRMYPLVAFLQRKCTKPFQIPDTKYTVETGTHIIIPLYSLHHDQKYYPDPQTFDPERFAEGRTLRKGTYLPFGDGPRICIGMRFAQLEVKVFIARIMSEFNIRLNKKTIQPLEFEVRSFIMETKGGLWLDFEKRIPS